MELERYRDTIGIGVWVLGSAARTPATVRLYSVLLRNAETFAGTT